MKRYFDTVIFGLGLFFLGFGVYLLWQREAPRDLVFAQSSPSAKVITPTRLTIASASIDLPIYGAKIVDHKWELTRDGVSYLSTSPLPGKQGNTVMYGHNWGNLLGDLKKVKPGDQLVVTQNNGDQLTYTVHFVTEVTPDQTHIYQNTSDFRLTLYTCSGFLDSKRLVVTAILN